MPVWRVLPGIFDCLFVEAVNILAAMGFTVGKVKTELIVHVIARDRAIAMRYTIQGSGISMTVHGYQARLAEPDAELNMNRQSGKDQTKKKEQKRSQAGVQFEMAVSLFFQGLPIEKKAHICYTLKCNCMGFEG